MDGSGLMEGLLMGAALAVLLRQVLLPAVVTWRRQHRGG